MLRSHERKSFVGHGLDTEQLYICFTLAGNKTDRDDREIPSEVGDEFAQRHGMYFLETSAKASDNVERLFTEIAHELLQVQIISQGKGCTL